MASVLVEFIGHKHSIELSSGGLLGRRGLQLEGSVAGEASPAVSKPPSWRGPLNPHATQAASLTCMCDQSSL